MYPSDKVFKVAGLTVGAALVLVVAICAFLVLDSGGSKDRLVQQQVSPDGSLLAELHQRITPQHGGSDTLYLTLRQANGSFGDEVYSRTYECSDLSAFKIDWTEKNELRLSYGGCNSGRWHTKEENDVQKSDPTWRSVRILYEDTKHVATR